MFQNIIIGVDGSDASMRAVKIACSIAASDAKLWLVHTPLPDTVAFATGAIAGYQMVSFVPDSDEVKQAVRRVLDDAKAAAATAGYSDIMQIVRHGDPGDEILAVAKDKTADLIVTGRRGLGNFAGLLIGSTSQRIAHHATCAVLSVP